MKEDLQIALEINENISLAKRLMRNLNALIYVTCGDECGWLRVAREHVKDAIEACGDAMDAIDDRANTGIRMDQMEDGRDEPY